MTTLADLRRCALASLIACGNRLVERVGQVVIDRAIGDAHEASERNRRWAETRGGPRTG